MAATNTLPDPPTQLKAIQSYMRIASDVDRVDPVVGYWVRLFSTETALKIDRESPECKTFLGALILWLEKFKQVNKENEAVSNQTVGQAHMENFVVALFNKADTLDRAGTANKNTVRMFYMAAVLFEAMAVFGPLTEEVSKRAKYAKFKAAYIQKCLKTGETPVPGPLEGDQPEELSSNAPAGSGGLDLPKVPDDVSEPSQPPNLTKPQDPFVMTPGSPPKLPVKPELPPTIPPSPPQAKLPQQPAPANPSCVPFNAPSATTPITGSTISATKFHAANGAPLNPEDILLGQKYCKFANSALQYDDITTAVLNLEKALKLLKMGEHTD